MKKQYQGFWLGRQWVSRCARCGQICFTVSQEQEHDIEKCKKMKLIPLLLKDTSSPPGESNDTEDL